jgi:hypothetical protein
MRKTIESIIHPGVIFGAIVIAAMLIGGIYYLYFYNQPPRQKPPPATPSILITSAPTSTALGFIPPTGIPTPTLEVPPSPIPGTILIGGTVQVSGTGGDGLNLRSSPEISGDINYLGFEAEVFIVQDGPIEADGYIWWYLVGFSDETRNGWGVSNFMEVVQNPG